MLVFLGGGATVILFWQPLGYMAIASIVEVGNDHCPSAGATDLASAYAEGRCRTWGKRYGASPIAVGARLVFEHPVSCE